MEEDDDNMGWSSKIKAEIMWFGGGGAQSRWLKEEKKVGRKYAHGDQQAREQQAREHI